MGGWEGKGGRVCGAGIEAVKWWMGGGMQVWEAGVGGGSWCAQGPRVERI